MGFSWEVPAMEQLTWDKSGVLLRISRTRRINDLKALVCYTVPAGGCAAWVDIRWQQKLHFSEASLDRNGIKPSHIGGGPV